MELPRVLGLLGGLVMSSYGVGVLWLSVRASRWPRTQGTVVAARPYRVDDSDGGYTESHVLYRYQVNGVTYRNDRRHPGWHPQPKSAVAELDPWPPSDGELQGAREQMPRGSTLIVRYKPRDPAESTLSELPDGLAWIALVVGPSLLYLAA